MPPLAVARGYTAFINGGYLVQPHVVKQVLDADGNIIENVEPEEGQACRASLIAAFSAESIDRPALA